MMTCVFSREKTKTLPRFLGVELNGVYFSAWWSDHTDFVSTMASYTDCGKTLSRSFASDASHLPIPRVC